MVLDKNGTMDKPSSLCYKALDHKHSGTSLVVIFSKVITWDLYKMISNTFQQEYKEHMIGEVTKHQRGWD